MGDGPSSGHVTVKSSKHEFSCIKILEEKAVKLLSDRLTMLIVLFLSCVWAGWAVAHRFHNHLQILVMLT